MPVRNLQPEGDVQKVQDIEVREPSCEVGDEGAAAYGR
ncbi:hypothetical protein pipiens_018945, partial [Culex pipiens pipiens]